ncbi:hypothetical protein [Streptomyces sp. NPDC012888]|uniref:hypothetical protein n=1 Tax=Streptomyces sp. NPDC012888 TaxID=3364855 RepID=UPI0036B271A1
MESHTRLQPALPLGAVPAQPGLHVTETAERGSFAVAQCSCGWRGPARRSRDKARDDASRHPAA